MVERGLDLTAEVKGSKSRPHVLPTCNGGAGFRFLAVTRVLLVNRQGSRDTGVGRHVPGHVAHRRLGGAGLTSLRLSSDMLDGQVQGRGCRGFRRQYK